MILQFATPTILSMMDLVTMGDSSKRDDPTKIGQFSTGLKYALALLLRDNVEVYIDTTRDNQIQNRFNFFASDATIDGKIKNLIHIKHTQYCTNEIVENTIQTGFALKLGYDWELWMGLRELWSNMVDEEGFVAENSRTIVGYKTGTVVNVICKDDSNFAKIWNDRHLYINQKEPLFQLSDVDILENTEGYLRIYKRNILVYQDVDVPSVFAYNIHFGEIDERRLLSDVSGVRSRIQSIILFSSNVEFFKFIFNPDFKFKDADFLNQNGPEYYSASNVIADVMYAAEGDIKTFTWLMSCICKREDCPLPGRKINNKAQHWARDVSVNSVPVELPNTEEDTSFQSKISKLYRFDIGDTVIKEAALAGAKSVADPYNKCIIIAPDFDMVKDFGEFITQYLCLITNKTAIHAMTDYILDTVRIK